MKHGAQPYTSAFYLWKGVAALFFSSCRTPFHCHNTLQIILDTQSHFKLRLPDQPWQSCKSLIIHEGVVHQLDTNDSVQLIIYLDPEMAIARAIKDRYLEEKECARIEADIFQFVSSESLQLALLKPDAAFFENLVNEILNVLGGGKSRTRLDPRIAKVEQLISTTDPHQIDAARLADFIHLSQSRMRSLFKKTTGMPLHQYILWNRIRFATNRLMAGASIQEAAFDAGFTDSSHLHKMMLKMFGISPSQFLKNNQPLQIIKGSGQTLDFKTLYFS